MPRLVTAHATCRVCLQPSHEPSHLSLQPAIRLLAFSHEPSHLSLLPTVTYSIQAQVPLSIPLQGLLSKPSASSLTRLDITWHHLCDAMSSESYLRAGGVYFVHPTGWAQGEGMYIHLQFSHLSSPGGNMLVWLYIQIQHREQKVK